MEYAQVCTQSKARSLCSVRCACWQFLAPHRFATCVAGALKTIAQAVDAGAYLSDCEDLTRGLLGHAWECHTTSDTTGLDELRRAEAVMGHVEANVPQVWKLVESFVDDRITEAFNRDTEEECAVGAFPCGSPIGDVVQHWRLAEMTTTESWAQVLRDSAKHETPMCAHCERVAAQEIALTA